MTHSVPLVSPSLTSILVVTYFPLVVIDTIKYKPNVFYGSFGILFSIFLFISSEISPTIISIALI